jgi:hypothetical protein
MPPNHGCRLHDDERVPPVEHSCQDGKAHARCCVHAPRSHTALYEQCELAAQKKVFSLNRVGRSKQQPDEPQDVREQVNPDLDERDHVPIMP